MQTPIRILIAIFSRSSKSLPVSRLGLARSESLGASELERALDELERAGWLDPARLRLTLSGLAIAVACSAEAMARRHRKPPSRRALARRDLAA